MMVISDAGVNITAASTMKMNTEACAYMYMTIDI
jgi:hypothetical protein